MAVERVRLAVIKLVLAGLVAVVAVTVSQTASSLRLSLLPVTRHVLRSFVWCWPARSRGGTRSVTGCLRLGTGL